MNRKICGDAKAATGIAGVRAFHRRSCYRFRLQVC